jgi:hypothetical protein
MAWCAGTDLAEEDTIRFKVRGQFWQKRIHQGKPVFACGESKFRFVSVFFRQGLHVPQRFT